MLANGKKVVGSKQTLRALERGLVSMVFVAADAELHVIQPIRAAAGAAQVPCLRAESMSALGKACGIKVGTASAALLK